MSTERDRYEPTEADLQGSADNRFAPPRQDLDREVALPPQAQPADAPAAANAGVSDNEHAALFESNVLNDFNTRWTDVQTGFVDEPRRAVQQADALVSDVIQRIADSFGNERAQLEKQWDRGGEVSTEDLRQALRRYRSFFSRLLTL